MFHFGFQCIESIGLMKVSIKPVFKITVYMSEVCLPITVFIDLVYKPTKLPNFELIVEIN